MRKQVRYAEAKMRGICTICYARPAEDGLNSCGECRVLRHKFESEYGRRRRNEAKAAGLCVEMGCDRNTDGGTTLCALHLAQANARTRKHKLSKAKERKREGLCVVCGQSRGQNGTGVHCYRHRIESIMRCAVRYALESKGQYKRGYTWESLVEFTLDDFLAHVEYWRKTQGISSDEMIEMHHINPVAGSEWQNPGDDEWRKLWALENLMPLRIIDHKEAHRGQ